MKLFKKIALICFTVLLFSTVSFGMDSLTDIPGTFYCFSEKEDYLIEGSVPTVYDTYGQFQIQGDISDISTRNEIPEYLIKGTSLNIFYNYTNLNKDNEWQLVEDNSKVVNGLNLNEKIQHGVIIIQTSKDGVKWTQAASLINMFELNPTNNSSIYSANDIQLENGTYYRVIVAYKMAKLESSNKILFIEKENYKYERRMEVYTFYAQFSASVNETQDNNRMLLGSKVNTGDKDNGYSGFQEIDNDDPHFGWDLGSFFVSGYTQSVDGKDGNLIFLKNVGDKVKFGFNLCQDIDRLNGQEGLSIYSEKKAFDQTFEVEEQAFLRGTLIIKYTNPSNESRTIVYTNFLEADATPDADTTIQMFEEGDYEVSLDYTIKTGTKFLITWPDYSHYKITTKFSIRNGNCMVFMKDSSSGSELTNRAHTNNGFVIDFANSYYLKVYVIKETLAQGKDGWTLNEEFNRPAKDGATYIDEGIYTIKVENEYTKQTTTKMIYVGNDKVSKAYVISGLTASELEQQIKNGATINDDGTITLVEIPSQDVRPNSEKEPDVSNTSDDNLPIVLIVIVALILIFVIISINKNKKKKQAEKEYSNEEKDT